MRTLKKTLCLVLALVMVLGLCAFNAAAFTDDASIKYDEAVGVMTAAGVLKGFEDGSFQPTSTLTRAQAATMITKMMGFDGVKGTTTFTDTQGHWGESYIAFCVAEGIVSGYGDGTFGPDDTLTGSQWAKMVICAMGYNAAAEGFAGDTWEVAVAKKVKTLKLAINIKAFDGTQPISRETACELGFQAMQGDLVEYTPGITVNGVEIPGDTKVITPAVSMLDNLDIVKATTAGVDDYGRPNAVKYTNTDGTKTLYTAPVTAAVTYTKATTATTIEADLKGYKVNDNATDPNAKEMTDKNFTTGTIESVNGAGAVAITVGNNTNDKFSASLAALTGNGVTVEVYATEKVITKVVVTQETLIEIGETNKTTKAVTVTRRAGAAYAATSVGTDDACYAEIAALTKGDFALITTCDGAIASVKAPETVVGAVTKVNSDHTATTVGGQVLATAANAGAVITTLDKTKDYTTYLDSCGNIMHMVIVSGATVTEVPVLFIADAWNPYDEYGLPSHKAQVVDEEGAVSTIPVKADMTGSKGKLCTYTVDADTGIYTLAVEGTKTVETATEYGAYQLAADVTPTSGAKKIDTANGERYYANSLKFIYVTEASHKVTVTVKEGLQTSALTASATWVKLVKSSSNSLLIDTVFVGAAAPDSTSSDFLFFGAAVTEAAPTGGCGYDLTGKTKVAVYKCYIGGEATEILTAEAGIAKAAGFWGYTKNETTGVYTLDGSAYTTNVVAKNALVKGTTVTAPVDSYLVTAGGTCVDFVADDATIVDLSTAGNLGTLEALAAANDNAADLYIVYDATAKTVTTIYVVDHT